MNKFLFAFSILTLVATSHSQQPQRYVAAVSSNTSPQDSKEKAKSPAGGDAFTSKLIDNPKCSEDIKRLCGKDVHSLNNFAVLECIQNEERDDSALISKDCHHILWKYKYDLTQSSHVEELAKAYCKDDIEFFNDCSKPEGGYGNTISCLIDKIDKIKKDKCRQYVIRFGSIIFSDYHLVQHMTEGCKGDIEKLSCGRVQTGGSNNEPHSQGLTIECLIEHTDQLQGECKLQIFKLAELQSEDFHLDRAFYFACRGDRDKFCKEVKAGQGQVYKCLFQHRKEITMSNDCSEQLTNRRNLIVRDYQVSKSLVKACHNDIKENQCRKYINKNEEAVVKLPKILKCLEFALRKGKIANGECKEEIIAHRQTVLEISPTIIEHCKKELVDLCSEARGPNKLHCLLRHFVKRTSSKIGPECRRAIEDVMKVSDPAEDWRVDPILHDACLPVVQSKCVGLKGGEGRIMRCLMRNINSPQMTQDCEAALLEIQYFVARDWKLDPQLYRSCRNDSKKFCHADHDWTDPSVSGPDADNSIMVLPCLFRYAYHPKPQYRLSQACSQDVRRVMVERAAFVQLHPQIEMECLEPLVTLCSENTGPGEEILCLQKNLDRLHGSCLSLIKNYTEAEAKDVGLNNLVNTYCNEVIDKLCSHVVPNNELDEGAVMDCLVKNKNVPEMKEHYKCRAVVENFQLIMIKDIMFTPKFKMECHESVKQYCSEAHSRKDVLDCLSDRILSDVLNEDRAAITKACRQQVRKQVSQRHESVNLDPDLKMTCQADIERHCSETMNPGMILECLRDHRKELSEDCLKVVFKREKEESADPMTDVVLLQNCKQMIKVFCREAEPDQLFACLKHEKDNSDFDMKCRNVLMQRLIERSRDISLNPQLYRACRKDANSFCRKQLQLSTLLERNGKVIECLKERLHFKGKEGRLSHTCELKIIQITKNAALNYKLDPVMLEKCKADMNVLCPSSQEDSEKGEMEECMKLSLEHNKITNEDCKLYVAEIMQREAADIHADPILFQTCKMDDEKYCKDMQRGSHLSCLFSVLDRNPTGLEKDCRAKLRERREMYKTAIKVAKLETFEDIVESVRASPKSNILYGVLIGCISTIFIVGLLCGRASRRTYKLLKNR